MKTTGGCSWTAIIASIFLSSIVTLSGCGGGGGSETSTVITGNTNPGGGSTGGTTDGETTVNPPTPPAPPTSSTGSVAGTLIVSNQILPMSASVVTSSKTSEAAIVPGEIIVRFKDGIDVEAALTSLLSKYAHVGLANAGYMYLKNTYLLRTDAYQSTDISVSEAKKQTYAVIDELMEEPAVQYAEPNGISKPNMIPNETAFGVGLQWDMSMINLPTAWELTTGSSSVIVAVLDTGIRSHPDLDPNVLTTGYDFVGMDSDPSEPLNPNANFHGTHVAGTIAAVGNNNSGMAGVAWNVKIMPVRVLGPLPGSEADIFQGMLYAAGLPNASGTVPPQPANVLNMSLGGANACSQTYQAVINEVINAGVAVVAAAGNGYQEGNPVTSPASCQGVIAVGAVDPLGYKTTYSQSHPYVTLVAPGGELGEGIHAGILSTFPVSAVDGPFYRFYQGTSMAAPHVSGVVALMLSANPNLTPPQITNILTSTADPMGEAVPNNDIGYGLVDAGKAVAAAMGVSTPSVPVPYPFPSLFNFQQIFAPMQSTNAAIFNLGGATLSLAGATPYIFTPQGGTWLSATLGPSCSSIAPSDYCQITYYVDPAGLPNGEYYGAVIVASNGGNFAVPVMFRVGAPEAPSITGAITVQLWNVDAETGDLTGPVATTTTSASQNYNYIFQSVAPGQYAVVAGVDKNSDGVFGDYFWEISTMSRLLPISVVAGQTTNVGPLQIVNVLDDIVNGI